MTENIHLFIQQQQHSLESGRKKSQSMYEKHLRDLMEGQSTEGTMASTTVETVAAPAASETAVLANLTNDTVLLLPARKKKTKNKRFKHVELEEGKVHQSHYTRGVTLPLEYTMWVITDIIRTLK